MRGKDLIEEKAKRGRRERRRVSTCILIDATLCVNSNKKRKRGSWVCKTKISARAIKFWRQANESVRVRRRTWRRGLCALSPSSEEKYQQNRPKLKKKDLNNKREEQNVV